MNERLATLIDLAYDEVCHERDWDAMSSVFNKEKFTRLLLDECFTVLTPYLDDQFIDDVRAELNEHFGVKANG